MSCLSVASKKLHLVLTWYSSILYVRILGLYQLKELSNIKSSVPSRTLLNVPDIGSRSEGTLELPKIFSSWRPLQRYSTEKAISPISVEKLYLQTLPAKLGIGNSKRCCTWSPAQVHVSGSFEFWSIPMKQASRDSKKWFSVIIDLSCLLVEWPTRAVVAFQSRALVGDKMHSYSSISQYSKYLEDSGWRDVGMCSMLSAFILLCNVPRRLVNRRNVET